MRRWVMSLLALALVGCDYVERTREIGYKGKARVNPYLAAERFMEKSGLTVTSESGWPALRNDEEIMMLLVPASVLSAEGYVSSLEAWIRNGGHAVLLLSHAEHYRLDWTDWDGEEWLEDEERSETFRHWAASLGVELDPRVEGDPGGDLEKIELAGERYEVFMEAEVLPSMRGGEPSLVVSRELGMGRVSFVSDARVLRNRYIGDHDHAALLLALAEASPYEGTVRIIRSATLSFWSLLWQRGWPAVVALLLLIVLWLWKSLPRFGPLDSRQVDRELRAYDHHLEALGGFHWRLDRAQGLLKPLRVQILERAQHLALASGQRDTDIFDVIAERTGIGRERVERAMTFERARDAGSFTRLIADLQTIHQSIP